MTGEASQPVTPRLFPRGAVAGPSWSDASPPASTEDLADIAMADGDTLLLAIESRLRMIAGRSLGAASVLQLQSDVLECVQALEQVHGSLVDGRLHEARVHARSLGLPTRLDQALSELAATRADRERAYHCALHDGLTSLPNRSFFRQHLERALQAAPRAAPALAVLYLDLDGMKAVNDSHGHAVGDRLLRVVAARLVHTLRGSDIVSRLGGDEFALLLADLPGAHDVGLWAARICDAVSAPVQLGTLQLRIRTSIGIAMCPEHGDSADALLHNADMAMYHAKRRQSGFAFFGCGAAP